VWMCAGSYAREHTKLPAGRERMDKVGYHKFHLVWIAVG